jgi:hypothetical protein
LTLESCSALAHASIRALRQAQDGLNMLKWFGLPHEYAQHAFLRDQDQASRVVEQRIEGRGSGCPLGWN